MRFKLCFNSLLGYKTQRHSCRYLTCALSLFTSFSHANDHAAKTVIETAPLNYTFAPACEAIAAQGPMLLAIQQQLQQHPEQRQKILNQFWRLVQQRGTPLIEPLNATSSRVTFLWRGATHNVRLVSGPSHDHEWLTRLTGSDIWFKELIVENQFIGGYLFAVDIANLDGYLSAPCPQLDPKRVESRPQRLALLNALQLDPHNPELYLSDEELADNRHSNIKFRNENLLLLPDIPAFTNPDDFPNHATPQLKSYQLDSKILGTSRLIQIYQSQKTKADQDYITAIFFDGQHYAELLQVAKALDLLVTQGQLPAIQVIFVSHPSAEQRAQELTPNPTYTDFFAQELLPSIDQHLAKLGQPRQTDKTVLLGSSLGGLSAAYLALQFPQQISHVVPMSGSFWWKNHPQDSPNGISHMIRQSKSRTNFPQHWYISANSYEYSTNESLSIWETAPIVAQDLTQQGHDVRYKAYIGGHSYALWQIVLQDALLHFFAEKNAQPKTETSKKFKQQ